MLGKAILLGTGAAVPTDKRGVTSIYVKLMGYNILIDAGEGTQFRLSKAGGSALTLDYIIITHMHGDHVLGLPGLLQSMSLHGRSKPLTILGPRGITDFIESINKSLLHEPRFEIKIIEYSSSKGSFTLGSGINVVWFEVDHVPASYGIKIACSIKGKLDVNKLRELGIPPGPHLSKLQQGVAVKLNNGRLVTLILVLKAPPRTLSLVYSGDTRLCDNVIEASKNASILIHDSTFSHEDVEHARELGHSTNIEAAIAASRANVNLLVLTHFSAKYHDVDFMAREARRLFPHTIAAEDFMTIILA